MFWRPAGWYVLLFRYVCRCFLGPLICIRRSIRYSRARGRKRAATTRGSYHIFGRIARVRADVIAYVISCITRATNTLAYETPNAPRYRRKSTDQITHLIGVAQFFALTLLLLVLDFAFFCKRDNPPGGEVEHTRIHLGVQDAPARSSHHGWLAHILAHIRTRLCYRLGYAARDRPCLRCPVHHLALSRLLASIHRCHASHRPLDGIFYRTLRNLWLLRVFDELLDLLQLTERHISRDIGIGPVNQLHQLGDALSYVWDRVDCGCCLI